MVIVIQESWVIKNPKTSSSNQKKLNTVPLEILSGDDTYYAHELPKLNWNLLPFQERRPPSGGILIHATAKQEMSEVRKFAVMVFVHTKLPTLEEYARRLLICMGTLPTVERLFS